MFERPRSIEHDLVFSSVTGVAIALAGRSIAVISAFLGASPSLAHWLDDILTGVIAGVFMFFALRVIAERRTAAIKRLRDIGEMNHHVRNALEVIRYAHVIEDAKDRIQIIDEASARIESAMREFNV